jgi:hypothetical protein
MSYNGWSASTSPHDLGGLDNRAVAGVRMAPGVRSGDVATVLFYVAEQFHRRVEPLVAGWCWGYSYRQNRNAANLSCHSSATAIDLNAPRHPNGKRNTFTPAQVTEVRKILAEVQNTVRWGRDFTGTPDEMHFEIVASPATVSMVAGRLNPKGPAGSPVTILPAPAPAPIEEDDMFEQPDRNQLNELSRRIQALTDFVGTDASGAPLFKPTKVLEQAAEILSVPLHSRVEGSTFEAPPRDFWALTDAAAYRTEQQVAGLSAAVAALADKVGAAGGASADELKAAVTEAMQQVVQVRVSVEKPAA